MTVFRPEDETGGILAAIVDASHDAIISTDLDGVIRSWNPAAERLYGYRAAEVTGRPISLILPLDRRDEIAAVLDRINTGERVEHYETVRQRKDGRLVDVSLTVAPVRNAAGSIVGATAIARDLTGRKRADVALRTSEMRWRSIVDSAVDGIIVIDAHGRIEAFNRGAERLFGYRALEVIGRNVKMLMPPPYHEEHDGYFAGYLDDGEHEVIGRNVSMLMPSPYHEEHDAYLARYLDSGVPKIIGIGREVTGLRRDGTTFPLHLSVGEMTVAGERKFTGIIHDLSARVRIEEQLREHTALARLGEMAAVIAHEVKNPLAGVRGAIQVIGARLPKESKDAAIVKEIVTRIDALNGLMQDLLLFARPPQPKSEPVDLAALVMMTADLLSGDPARKEIEMIVEGSAPPVEADAGLLKIVFENLLVNGAQAMQGHGTIHVSLTSMDDTCQISFSDNGPGIPVEVREKIFMPFFTTKALGSGLGLPTAKRLIEAHRGRISIACPPGGGTTVTIQLPAQSAATG